MTVFVVYEAIFIKIAFKDNNPIKTQITEIILHFRYQVVELWINKQNHMMTRTYPDDSYIY